LLVPSTAHPARISESLRGDFDVDAGNLILVLDGLEAEGLLERTRDKWDRRQRLVSLTPKGQRVLAATRRATAAAETKVFAGLPASE
jgi:DNA-binding MarR family transcriptional regulator